MNTNSNCSINSISNIFFNKKYPISLVISKIQMVIFLTLLCLPFSYFYSEAYYLLFLLLLLYFYFVFIELRKVVKKDEFFSYVLFFSALCLSIILAFLLPKIIHSYYSSVLPIFLVMLIYFFFYINAKNICIAKVIYSDKDSAIVEKDFDLLSMTSAGEYKVSSSKRYKKGTTVKVSVKQTLFGKKPDKIISSINE